MSATSYNNQEPKTFPYDDDSEDRTGVSAFLASHFKRHDDLRTMLDSTKDGLKLDAMKRIVGMMASGRDVSELFPAVVKNVVSKSIEVKKLVYVYLVRYAEEQQDLALLSISTFQRALKDPNQLIRASALRVLSSIRVPVIVPIMMLSLKEAVTDLSPYVRKTAANAIPKLYSMDPEQKDTLVEIIEKLLQDKTTLVIGSAVTAFEEVCPDRIDLIHKNYRKMCNMLIDIDEWGQVAVVNMLTRYARSQFTDPNKNEILDERATKFYPSSESEESETQDNSVEEDQKKGVYVMDADHRLLLRSAKSLLQSRNAAVVMAVVRLYHHCAPANEVNVVVRALIRLLRSHREVQTVVLSNLASMSVGRKGLFEPHIKSFFVHSGDPTHIRLLKLEILTNIATESSISMILKEFQTYVTSADKQFAASTIQAIGRCAANIPEVTDTCLSGLVRLLSNRDELVVGESVVVIKNLLQTQRADHSEIIIHMAKLIDKINVAMARASILWLIGEYADRVPKIAPDVLRKMGKTFVNEESIVKLQILNLGAKLYLSNQKQVKLLCQYVLQLAKYDTNYDIRDRGRFIRCLLFPPEGQKENRFRKDAKLLFLSEKPAPVLESVFKDRGQYQVGSLSHLINARAQGYQDLPDFPEIQPDATVRNVEVDQGWGTSLFQVTNSTKKKRSFYSESEGEEGDDGEESSSVSSETDTEGEDLEEEEDDQEGEDEDEDEDKDEEDVKEGNEAEGYARNKNVSKRMTASSEEESDSQSDGESEEEESEEDAHTQVEHKRGKASKDARDHKSYDQLLDLDDFSAGMTLTSNINILTPSLVSEMDSLSLNSSIPGNPNYTTASGHHTKALELLNKIAGQGLSGEYVFLRAPCIYGSNLVAVEVLLKNNTSQALDNIHFDSKRLSPELKVVGFQEVASLAPEQSITLSLGIDFRDTTQPANFDICTKSRKFPVSIKAPVGELIQKHSMSDQEFLKEQVKLTGMNENCASLDVPRALLEIKSMSARVLETANMAMVPSTSAGNQGMTFRYVGRLISSGMLVLLTIDCTTSGNGSKMTVNCEKISISSMLSREIKNAIIRL